jgi:hypothetical protein
VADFCKNSNSSSLDKINQTCFEFDGGIHAAGPSRNKDMEPNNNVESVYLTCKNEEAAPALLFSQSDCKGRTIRLDFTDDKAPEKGKQDFQ